MSWGGREGGGKTRGEKTGIDIAGKRTSVALLALQRQRMNRMIL